MINYLLCLACLMGCCIGGLVELVDELLHLRLVVLFACLIVSLEIG